VTIKCQTYAGSTFVVIQHIPENDPCNRNTCAKLNVYKCEKQKLRLPRRILNSIKMRYISHFYFLHHSPHLTLHGKCEVYLDKGAPIKKVMADFNKELYWQSDWILTLDKFHLNSPPKFTLHILFGYLRLVGRWCADNRSHRQ